MANTNEQINAELTRLNSGLQGELNILKQASSYFVSNAYLTEDESCEDGEDEWFERVEEEKRQLKFNYFQDWKKLAMEAYHHPERKRRRG